MTVPMWGLLGPSEVSSLRRTRTLGVAAAVRSFNDLAVPGMGNVWFGKQIFLATLGVAVAERADNPRLRNIPVTNAIEALACWTDFTSNGWKSDARLQGFFKLRGKPAPTFQVAKSRGFYVSQPMRSASIQPLVALGLVEAPHLRFNSFRLSATGSDFVDLVVSGHRPDRLDLVDFLARWIAGSTRGLTSPALGCIRPTVGMPLEARERLLALMVTPDAAGLWSRRKAVMDWLDSGGVPKLTWSRQPEGFEDQHWADLYLGSIFFRTRDAALQLLDRIEVNVRCASARSVRVTALATDLQAQIGKLRALAREFLQPSPRWFPAEFGPKRLPERVSTAFCQACSDPSDLTVLTALLERDDRVLRLRGDNVVPGPAFLDVTPSSGDMDDVDTDSLPIPSEGIDIPSGISTRISSMFLLHRNLHPDDPPGIES